jgi:hypothetical protein
MFETKVQKIPKIQMEHFQNRIFDLNIMHKRKRECFDYAFCEKKNFELLDFVQILLILKEIQIH